MRRNDHRAPAVGAALLTTLATLALLPGVAHADALKFWFAARGNYFSGQSDLFQEFDEPFGGGLEAGLEFLGITLFADATSMIPKSGAIPDQWLFTGNLGVDLTFGTNLRFHIGAYTGPILFLFPQGDPPAGVDFDRLSPETRQAIEESGQFEDLMAAEDEFNRYSQQEAELSRLAFGWNLGRARLALDYKFGKIFAIGVAGQVGYHYLISGEQAAAGAKNAAIDNFAAQYMLPDQVAQELRSVVGASPVNPDDLNGLNYDATLYFRFEFTTAN